VTHTFGPGLVFNFRAGLARFLGQSGSSIGKDFDLGSLGFAPQFVSQAVAWFPRFNWTGYEGAGANPSQYDPISQVNSFAASVAAVKGRHSIKTGLGLGNTRKYRTNPGYWAGNFTFDQTFTGQNPISIQPSSGNSIASFLLGTPQSGFIDVNTRPALQERFWSLYVQDDIRLTSKLKVNVGLRWDYLSPVTDRFDALSRGFDFTSPSPLKAPGLDLKGGLLFAGSGGSRGIFKSDWNNFGPRFGFAYNVASKTVLRGGYGLIYAGSFDDPGPAPGFSQSTAMVTFIQTGLPQNTLTNPFPSGILRPVGNAQGLSTYLGQGFSFPNPDRVIPWTHQFSFEIQRELPAQFLISAAYVGSRTRGLEVSKGINEIPLSTYALGSTALTANVANPMAGLIPGTSLNGATVQRQQLLRPYPQFLGLTELYLSVGESKYDSFQVMLYKRLSAGLNFSVAYTNSKTLEKVSYANPQDTQLLKQVAAWDIPQNLQINGVYELPFGKGKPLGGTLPAVVSKFVSGWSVSGIARIQEGLPMTFPTNAVPTGVSPGLSNRSLERWFNTCTLLPNGTTRGCLSGEQPVWTILQPFTVRTWPTKLSSVRVPAIRNLDASVIKNNYIRERYNLIFRVDFLNATNSVQFFSGPVVDVNNPNFGRISPAQAQSNLPRFIQLSLRFQF
jgi:TonB dependent receptor